MPETQEKPVLFADDRSDAERFDPSAHRGYLDPSRIPGYSEVVQANDIAKADDLVFRDANRISKEEMYAKLGAKPRALEVEFAWLPVSGVAGGESHAQARVMDRYQHQEGFRPVTYERTSDGLKVEIFEKYGFEWPPMGRPAEDGTIRRGSDTALFWRSGEVARKWDAHKLQEQAELEGRALSNGPESWHALEDRESRIITH